MPKLIAINTIVYNEPGESEGKTALPETVFTVSQDDADKLVGMKAARLPEKGEEGFGESDPEPVAIDTKKDDKKKAADTSGDNKQPDPIG